MNFFTMIHKFLYKSKFEKLGQLQDRATNNSKKDFDYGTNKGPSRAFSGRGICHFFRRDIGNVGLKNTGNGMKYTHDTENFLIFLFGRRENMN